MIRLQGVDYRTEGTLQGRYVQPTSDEPVRSALSLAHRNHRGGQIQSQRRIMPSEVPVARAFSKHCNPPIKHDSVASFAPFAKELKLALLQSVPARLPVPQLAN